MKFHFLLDFFLFIRYNDNSNICFMNSFIDGGGNMANTQYNADSITVLEGLEAV